MKIIVLFLTMLITSTSYADYFGTSIGNAQMNYDLKGEAYDKAIRENGEYSGPVLSLGGDIDISVQDTAGMSKLFYGLQLSRYAFIELFYVSISPFYVHADVDMEYTQNIRFDTEVSIDIDAKSYGTYSFKEKIEAGYVAHAKLNGQYNASIDLKGFGLKIVGISPIGDGNNFSVIGGFGLLDGRSVIKTSYHYDGEYDYFADSPFGNTEKSNTISESKTTYEEIRNIIPVFGFGLLYKVFDEMSIRMEFERYGHPANKLSIDVTSIGLQYDF